MASTATALVAEIQDYLVGHAIAAPIALSFIALAEAEISRRLRVRQMIRRATATVTDGYIELPSDFIAPLNMTLADNTALRMITPDQADSMRQTLKGGHPQCFCLMGTEIEILPNPTDEVDAELVYMGRPAALQPSVVESNAILVLAPDLYLMTALAFGAVYIADAERAAFFRGEADRMTAALNAESDAASYGASPLIVRPRRTYP